MTLNVSCVSGNCGTINVSLDPEMIKELMKKPGHSMVISEEELMEKNNKKINFEDNLIKNKKSFFERVVGFITSRWELMRGLSK